MLGIPFIENFIQNFVQKQKAADSIDFLNYYITAIILAFASTALSAKQYFGSPIQCWLPAEFKGGWEQYAEDYCFIASTYYSPLDRHLSQDSHKPEVNYYRWVPIVLAIQAFCFYLPNWIWSSMQRHTAINPDSFLTEAEKARAQTGDSREKEVQSLAEYFVTTISTFGTAGILGFRSRATTRSGYNAAFLYIMLKVGYVANLILQIYILNIFIGNDYMHWGYEEAGRIISGQDDLSNNSAIFPRVIMCDFRIRTLSGDLHMYSVQCVLMINILNEKLYLFLYFWFLMLLIVSLLNLIHTSVVLLIPQMRARLLNIHLDNVNNPRNLRFMHECLHPDGVLLLRFLKNLDGGRLVYELINKIIDMYESPDGKLPALLSKYPHSHPNYVRYTPPPTKSEYYPYLLELKERTSDYNQAAMDDYTKDTTMRVGDNHRHQSSPSRSSVV